MINLTKNRLIYTEDAIASIFQEADRLENNGAIPMGQGARAMAFVVAALPSAEPEIIRCGKCKHHILHKRLNIPWCRLLHIDMGDNEFCSCAERREDD